MIPFLSIGEPRNTRALFELCDTSISLNVDKC